MILFLIPFLLIALLMGRVAYVVLFSRNETTADPTDQELQAEGLGKFDTPEVAEVLNPPGPRYL